MIVKVQISLSTTLGETQVLIYDRLREFFAQAPLSACANLEEKMGGLKRAFFEAELDDKGGLTIGARLPEQGW